MSSHSFFGFIFTVQQAVTADPERTARGLQRLKYLGIALFVLSTLFSIAQVYITRRFASRAAWLTCLAVTALLVAWWLFNVLRVWPELLHPTVGVMYMVIMFAGAPLVAATAAITRSVARRPARSFINHTTRGWLSYVGGLIVGSILAALPDFVGMFSP